MFRRNSEKANIMRTTKQKAKEIIKASKEAAKEVSDKELKKQIIKCGKTQAKCLINDTRFELFCSSNSDIEGVKDNIEKIDVKEQVKKVSSMADRKINIYKKIGFTKSLKIELAFTLECMKLILSGNVINTVHLTCNQEATLDIIENVADKISKAKIKVNMGDIAVWVRRLILEHNNIIDADYKQDSQTVMA